MNQANAALSKDRPASVLEGMQGQLELLRARIATLNDSAGSMADRVFGSQPQAGNIAQPEAPEMAKLDEIVAQIEDAHAAMSSLESNVKRFAQL